MDAFAVSVTLGLSVGKPKVMEYLIPGIFFGFFQALMPFMGYFVGIYFSGIENLDHWVAFLLLGFIGGKMMKESFSQDERKSDENSFRFVRMLFLAVATSMDALAAGITFAVFRMNIVETIAITGMTTFFLSMAGVKTGNVFGMKLKSKAEFIGGSILVMLGLKILIEHLFFRAGN